MQVYASNSNPVTSPHSALAPPPRVFWLEPPLPATTKFGTKIVTAAYYRSDCENSLYAVIKVVYKPMSSALSRKI